MISSTKGSKCYVGSTISYKKRQNTHKNPKTNRTTSKQLFEEYGVDNCTFTVLEECTEEQRFERERHWMDNTANLVNFQRANVSRQERTDLTNEYNKIHKERHSELSREYYYRNREKVLERLRNKKNNSMPI